MISMQRLISVLCLMSCLLACNNNEPQVSRQSTPAVQEKSKIILVAGVTGRQGGAVARELLKSAYQVRGLSRNPLSDRAKAMTALGVEVVKGDFEDIASLDAAMEGVYGVFSVQNFWEHGFEAEVRQGKNFADAARRAGVSHFVYSSVANADLSTGIPHFDSKYEIEQYIQLINLPFTILRPVSFMENWEYSRDSIVAGKISSPFSPGTRLQQISVRDIGRFATLALNDPEDWIGRSLDIAGEQYTMKQAVNIFSRVTARPVEYVQVPWDVYEQAQGLEMTIMDRWIENTGYSANINLVRSELPDMLTLEEYLFEADW
jgi:uncharacterized protein YbjT (DUF2867 family)